MAGGKSWVAVCGGIDSVVAIFVTIVSVNIIITIKITKIFFCGEFGMG